MIKYILRRMLIGVATLFAIIFIVFGIMNLTPGDPAQMILGDRATPESVATLNHDLGFDRPFLVRYVDYVADLSRGDMGTSYRTGREVMDEIITRLPTTIKLASLGILIGILIGVPLGILAAVKQYSVFDILGTTFAMFMASMPSFWLGLMLILFFALQLGLLPSNGTDTWAGYILPAFTLGIAEAATLLRLTRSTMLETIRQDYVRTARAKGQKERIIIFHHALKNALLPVITVIGMDFGFLLGGVVTIEAVFSINGVGTLILTAIRMKDVPLVTGCALFLSLFFIIVMLIVDILYAYIDPRIKSRY